jgi:FkbH-like protein
MTSELDFYWLTKVVDWKNTIRTVSADASAGWPQFVALANHQLDFLQISRLDATVAQRLQVYKGELPARETIRLAILGSSTSSNLLAPLRVAGLRRGFRIEIYECQYGQYLQELFDSSSGLFAFAPDAILFALDAYHLTSGFGAADSAQDVDAVLGDLTGRLQQCWIRARQEFKCPVLQQTALPIFADLFGSNEHRLFGSRSRFVTALNMRLREIADSSGVDLVAVDSFSACSGVRNWHDPVMWHWAKQEISSTAAPFYGELVVRILAARLGRSYKALILDLDNTLWGGVIGDDGIEGIVLGQGSALGEAFVSFQEFARDLAARGIILAICSKNDEANALAPFESHPDMVLRKGDISCFVANWGDKATNIREIANMLNIGLDACVFVDDNLFEREFVRKELPMVAVPEMPEDVAFYARCIADAGYFEGVAITAEDLQRTAGYVANRERSAFQAQVSNLQEYLRGLKMQLYCRNFDKIGLQRIVQLINKTNQFNLRTRRYNDAEVTQIIADGATSFGLQLRLVDRFGDNGIIAIIIGRLRDGHDVHIDTWLMSCRVLGRNVEEASLNLIAAQAQKLGAERLIGEFIPTKANGMVKDHYAKLGFETLQENADGSSLSCLHLGNFVPRQTFIEIQEG